MNVFSGSRKPINFNSFTISYCIFKQITKKNIAITGFLKPEMFILVMLQVIKVFTGVDCDVSPIISNDLLLIVSCESGPFITGENGGIVNIANITAP